MTPLSKLSSAALRFYSKVNIVRRDPLTFIYIYIYICICCVNENIINVNYRYRMN